MKPRITGLFPLLIVSALVGALIPSVAAAAPKVEILVVDLNLDGAAVAPSVARLAAVLERLSGARVEVMDFRRVTGASIAEMGPRAVVLSPQSDPWWLWEKAELDRLKALVRGLKLPVLGVCGGHQLLAMAFGGAVGPIKGEARPAGYEGMFREKGRTVVRVRQADPLFEGLAKVDIAVHQFHVEEIKTMPEGFDWLVEGSVSPFQAIGHKARPVYGVQFHPESRRSPGPAGEKILSNFLKIAFK